MDVTGIIAEYNPFHSGHAYHLKRARELTHADYLLIVMGGNFMQRGEPALVDKYTRTKMALLGGADLVIELPTAYATGSAEYFADGAVSLLMGSGIVRALCFGSEIGDITLLEKAASLLLTEPSGYRDVLRRELKKGKSFPHARCSALQSELLLSPEQHEALLSSPNNILGIEYIKALRKRNSSISAYTIPRVGKYHETELGNGSSFASASAIRKEAHSLTTEKDLRSRLMGRLPDSSLQLLHENRPFVSLEDFSLPLHYRLLSASDPLDFSKYLDVSEDLSRRIFSLRHHFSGYNAFLDLVKTRQYTRSRISRSLLHILLDIRTVDLKPPSYLRVLGFRREAAPLLAQIKKNGTLPLVTKTAGHEELSRELAASALYHLGHPYSEQSQELIII